MAQIAYRANLSAAKYPLTLSQVGRSVIIPGPDNNFDRRVDPEGEQTDAGIPQAIYLDNVIPTSYGYQSVGYINPTTPMTVPAGASNIVKTFEVFSSSIIGTSPYQYDTIVKFPIFLWNNGALTGGPSGSILVTVTGTAWNTSFAFADQALISTAVVAGVCYVYYKEVLYQVTHDSSPNTIDFVEVNASVTPLNFFSANNIVSIAGSNNYLVAISKEVFYHSSVTSPLDFVSSLVTGAGSISPNNVDGAMVYLTANNAGIYIHGDNSTLLAEYTGNARYPWKFIPVTGSNGLFGYKESLVHGGVDFPFTIVAESSRQIKLLAGNIANVASPDVSDFLQNTTVQQILDFTSNTITSAALKTNSPNVYFFNNRYLVVSINGGTAGDYSSYTKYTHALIFDIQLKRMGRLKIDHDWLFSVNKNINTFSGFAENWLGFVSRDTNTISYANFELYNLRGYTNVTVNAHQGALILGKFQYVRSRFLQIQEIEIDGAKDTAIVNPSDMTVVLLSYLDGSNISSTDILAVAENSGSLVKCYAHRTAQCHSILIKNSFNLNTVQLRFVPRGDR